MGLSTYEKTLPVAGEGSSTLERRRGPVRRPLELAFSEAV